jgi:hypothetical protein
VEGTLFYNQLNSDSGVLGCDTNQHFSGTQAVLIFKVEDYSSTLNMAAACSSVLMVTMYQATLRHIPRQNYFLKEASCQTYFLFGDTKN